MKLEWKSCIRAGISLFILYLCIYYWNPLMKILLMLVNAAMPLIIGAGIAYLLNILMCLYEKYYFQNTKSVKLQKSRRPVCILLAVLTLSGIVVLIMGLVIPELLACIRLVASKLPAALENLQNSKILKAYLPENIMDSLGKIDWNSTFEKIAHVLTSGLGTVAEITITALSSVFSATVTFFLAFIFALYLLAGKDGIMFQADRLMKHYISEKWNEKLHYVLHILNDCFHRYIVGQAVEAVILGSLCVIGMLVLRLPYASMTGALVGFTALIPVAGAYIGAVVGAFMILTVSFKQAVVFVIFLVILQQLEGNLIYPRVVGESLGLPGIWVLAAVTVGGSLCGIPGMLLGVPLTAALYQIVRLDMEKKEG